MARIRFPSNPSDGNKHSDKGKTYRYDSNKNRWKVIGAEAVSATKADELDSTISTLQTQLAEVGGSVEVYANASVLPLTGLEAGQMAYNQANNSLLITNGSGWYSIALVNQDPSVTASVSSISLGADGNTAYFTYTISEPDGSPVIFTVANSGISNTSQGNVVHYSSNNTIEVNNFAAEGSEWTGTITLSASDGISVGAATVSVEVAYFTPVFAPTHSAAIFNYSLLGGAQASVDVPSGGNGNVRISWTAKSYSQGRQYYAGLALPYGKYYTEFYNSATPSSTYTMFTTTPYDWSTAPTNTNNQATSSGWVYSGSTFRPTPNPPTVSGLDMSLAASYRYVLLYDSDAEYWWFGKYAPGLSWNWGQNMLTGPTNGYASSQAGTKSTEYQFVWIGAGNNNTGGAYTFYHPDNHTGTPPPGYTALPLPDTVSN